MINSKNSNPTNSLRLRFIAVLTALVLQTHAGELFADVITIVPSRDATIYQPVDAEVNANGQGQFIFGGRIASGSLRRAMVEFDIAGTLPAGSVINDVSLQLYMSRTTAGPQSTRFHRVLADWAEGPTDAIGNEGFGDAAADGDTTWFDRVQPTTPWSSAGGDFSSLPSSGSVSVGGEGFYTWNSTSQMVSDVQAWLDQPNDNFGWMLIVNEGGGRSAKRFDSRQSFEVERRPQLTIDFTPPECSPPCAVPAVSFWGVAILALLTFVVGQLVFRRGSSIC